MGKHFNDFVERTTVEKRKVFKQNMKMFNGRNVYGNTIVVKILVFMGGFKINGSLKKQFTHKNRLKLNNIPWKRVICL